MVKPSAPPAVDVVHASDLHRPGSADEPTGTLVLRHPTREDGAAMWRLVHDHGGLELNTGYAYVVLSEHHAASSLVAYDGDALRGFVLGHRIPIRPDTLFVWQIGVHPSTRGEGLGRRMLLRLLDDGRAEGVRFLEATVTPANEPSQRLFRSVARDLGVPCDVRPYLTTDVFPEPEHEAEHLFRIGPI